MRRVPQRRQYGSRQPELRECKWSLKSPAWGLRPEAYPERT